MKKDQWQSLGQEDIRTAQMTYGEGATELLLVHRGYHH